jgi:ribosomal protein S18 acetylase RimI-like enzyme
MTVEDVREVARVHVDAFPGFFLTFLGAGFLCELYRGIVRDPAGIAFVAEHDGVCTGFVAGSAEPSGLYKRLIKRRLVAFGFHAGIAFLRRPSIAPRLLRAFTRLSEAPTPASGRAELMSLAVLPGNRGSGIGAGLMEAFVSAVRSRNGAAVFLTTDALDNDAVNAFYTRHGFTVSRRFATPEGRQMNEYELQVTP